MDSLGLAYDGSTLSKRGLGGSESAIILMARELAKLGFTVTVFNDCYNDDASPGIYDGVTYKPLYEIENSQGFDVFIASRSVVAFAPDSIKERFRSFVELPNFEQVVSKSKFKVLWMHDTFCDGDDLIEEFILQNRISEIFTLSDFHTTYVTNCNHGKRRNFEILKNKVFQTRNGIVNYIDWVDVKAKDPNLFVFNAAVSKGMVPLLEKVWPKVKERIPQAKLKVIGGFYKFKSGPDAQEVKFRELEQKSKDLGVEFTGIIKQSEIANIVAGASFFIYPAAFPETSGISTLEALNYNTPLITCRFGALEETAIDLACYKVAYAIEPNNLFPWINSDEQVEKFVNVVVKAWNTPYLHQQKMYACNQVKEIIGWDTVALQWKQHLFRVLGEYLQVEEYRKVQDINNKVRRIFGRRFSNQEDISYCKTREQEIVVITPVYNAEKFIGRCVQSVTQQDYDNYKMIIISDASTDNTISSVLDVLGHLPKNVSDKVKIISNLNRKGAVYNQITNIPEYCSEDSIVMLLDGDDWLVNDANIFNKYNNIYNDGAEFTYGSCWSLIDNIPLIAQPYPPSVKQSKAYRDYKFNWKMPYTHLRTFRAKLLNDLDESLFQDKDGNWLKAGGDTAVFYNLIEKADPDKVICIPDIVYCYNDANPLNDYKVNSDEQTRNSNMVTNGKVNLPYVVKDEVIDGTGPWAWSSDADLSWKYIKEDWHPLKNVILKHVDKMDVCVQAGGHQGMYPRLLHNHFKKVYTFEADPVNFYYLEKNCWQENIIKINAAVGAYERKVSLYRWNEHNTGCIVPQNNDNGDIPVVTIDSLNLEQCDLIQLDVERYEMFALMGAMKTIEKFRPLITCEGPETTNDVCTRILEQLGYQIVATVGTCNDTVYKYTGRTPPKRTSGPDPLLYTNNVGEKKKILLAIPTARNIEADTFKSIYDLYVPDGYEVTYQHFYGYNIDQVRNLIAHWAEKFDYLFSVDSDIVLPKDSLAKMLQHNVPMVSGVYIQRKPGQVIPEIYQPNDHGGVSNVQWDSINGKGLTEIAGCGFGCVLIKSEVIKAIGYPQFVYKSAINHADTVSEDVYFCAKAREKGFKIFVDPSIVCNHIGQTSYRP